MKLTLPRMLSLSLQLVAVSLLVVGCGTPSPKPVAWNLKITKPEAIEVDLVGVTAREKPRLESYAMDKYWSPGDLERKNADKITSAPTEAWFITKKDPKWKSWMGRRVVGLYVIANLPGNFEAGADARREFLSIDKHHWDAKKQTLEIEIQENRIVIKTPEELQ